MINTNYSFSAKRYNNYSTGIQKSKPSNISFEGNITQKALAHIISPKTEKDAIRKLLTEESGCYFKTENGYNFLSKLEAREKDNFNFENVIIKQPLKTRTILGMSSFGSFQYRSGVSPVWLIRGLQQKMGRLTFITGNKDKLPILQVLHFPKEEELNKVALEKVKDLNLRILAHKKYLKYLTPEPRNKFAYAETKETINELDLKGLRLEEFHLHK